jgi:hypothetical protein
MRIPITATHRVSLAANADASDPIDFKSLDELNHPVQRVIRRTGDDPQKWTYGDFFDMDKLLRWTRSGHDTDPMTNLPMNWDDYDDVVWEDPPSALQKGSHYATETLQRLQQARGLTVPQRRLSLEEWSVWLRENLLGGRAVGGPQPCREDLLYLTDLLLFQHSLPFVAECRATDSSEDSELRHITALLQNLTLQPPPPSHPASPENATEQWAAALSSPEALLHLLESIQAWSVEHGAGRLLPEGDADMIESGREASHASGFDFEEEDVEMQSPWTHADDRSDSDASSAAAEPALRQWEREWDELSRPAF